MRNIINFDIISDLNLYPGEEFNWKNNVTSLYCIIAGNISDDIKTVAKVLFHLSTIYQGVFFVPGYLEYDNTFNFAERTRELAIIADNIKNVVFLYNNIVTIDGIGILGSNGWGNILNNTEPKTLLMNVSKYQDYVYLEASLKKLQRYPDIKKIVIVTSAVPREDLYFGEKPDNIIDNMPLVNILVEDTEKKVVTWVFGTYKKPVDVFLDRVNYISNPKTQDLPYHSKRIKISI
jgi:hypothetical protein